MQILDRKNNETEVMKNMYKTKLSEAEDTIRKLEKKGDAALINYLVLLHMFISTNTGV